MHVCAGFNIIPQAQRLQKKLGYKQNNKKQHRVARAAHVFKGCNSSHLLNETAGCLKLRT